MPKGSLDQTNQAILHVFDEKKNREERHNQERYNKYRGRTGGYNPSKIQYNGNTILFSSRDNIDSNNPQLNENQIFSFEFLMPLPKKTETKNGLQDFQHKRNP